MKTRRGGIYAHVAAAGRIAIALLLGLNAAACGAQVVSPRAAARPNIVLIGLDDAGWKDFGYHGSEIQTPTIDRMAKEGVELDQFYVSPQCTPTRAGLMIGRPPSRIGVLTAVDAVAEHQLPDEQITIAEVLRRSGYDTALTGKWHLGNTLDYGPTRFGFNHGHGFHGPWVDFYTHKTIDAKTDWHRNGQYIEQEGHATDLIANEAINFITTERDQEKPFFIYVSFNAPHLPLQEDDEWLDRYRDSPQPESRRYYAAMITHTDDSIRRILEALQGQGLQENTLVVFFTDNGAESPGRKGYLRPAPTDRTTSSTEKYGDNSPLRGWKDQLYEGGVRVPAIAYWPGKLAPGKFAEPIAVYDMLPTLASLTGSPIPDEMIVEGVDFWPALQGERALDERAIYWHVRRGFAVRQGDWKLIQLGATPTEGESELYDIANDPNEQFNVVSEHPDRAASLREEMLRQFALDRQ